MSRLCVVLAALGLLALGGMLSFAPNEVWAQEETTIHITWPNEGETLYAGPSSLQYSAPIRGYIELAGAKLVPATMRLEIVRDGQQIGSLLQPLEGDTFEFLVTVNLQGSKEYFPAEHAACADDCHRPGRLGLVTGELTLRLTLLTANDEPWATAERHIVVDQASYATIPVTLLMQNGAGPVPAGVTMSGATRLYLWRSRHFLAQSGSAGDAQLRVEALSQAPTEYLVEVEPTIVDGVLYEGIDSRRVTILPGAQDVEPITLTVKATRGEIAGRVSPATPGGSVWAVCPADGHSLQAPVAGDGTFHMSNVPLDRYLLALDDRNLISSGYMYEAHPMAIDLVGNTRQEVDIPLVPVPSTVYSGRLLDQNEQPLPFAWVSTEHGARANPVIPSTAEYYWPDPPEERTTLILQAPGHYSRAAIVNPASPDAATNFTLKAHPETSILAWGAGSIILPDDSDIEHTEEHLLVRRGWLWGTGASDVPVSVRVGPHLLTIEGGDFAVEYLPGERGWLYLFQGRATLLDGNNGQRLALQEGQMVNLLNEQGLRAVPYDTVVVAALQSRAAPPLQQTWEPSLTARLRDGVARAGVGAAQIVTFVTYLLVCISIVAGPVYLLYLRAAGRRRRMAEG